LAEIFTSSGDETKRTVATELKLESPSDVHFGAADPGIAFYEKSGPDLSVTFLDGSTVLLRDFFVIGESGGYNRLLTGAGGAEEITGLVAPEPLVGSTVVSAHNPEDVPAEPPAAEQPVVEPPHVAQPAVAQTSDRPAVDIEWSPATSEAVAGGAGGAADAGDAGADGNGGFQLGGSGLFGGVAMDKLLFGTALVGTAALAFGPWSDSDSHSSSSSSGSDVTDSGEGTDETDATTAAGTEDEADDTAAIADDATEADDAVSDVASESETIMDEETAAYVSLLLGDSLIVDEAISTGAEDETATGAEAEGADMTEGDVVTDEVAAVADIADGAELLGLVSLDDGADLLGFLLDDGGFVDDDSLLSGTMEVLG